MAAEIKGAVDTIAELRMPSLREHWPHAAGWPEERLRYEAEAMIRHQMARGIESSAKDVADALERVAHYEWQQMSAADWLRAPATGRGATGQTSTNPKTEAEPKPAGHVTPQITGNDASTSVPIPAAHVGRESGSPEA